MPERDAVGDGHVRRDCNDATGSVRKHPVAALSPRGRNGRHVALLFTTWLLPFPQDIPAWSHLGPIGITPRCQPRFRVSRGLVVLPG